MAGQNEGNFTNWLKADYGDAVCGGRRSKKRKNPNYGELHGTTDIRGSGKENNMITFTITSINQDAANSKCLSEWKIDSPDKNRSQQAGEADYA